MVKLKKINLHNVAWGDSHPKHFDKYPHKVQIAARDRHLVRTNNKDGYAQ